MFAVSRGIFYRFGGTRRLSLLLDAMNHVVEVVRRDQHDQNDCERASSPDIYEYTRYTRSPAVITRSMYLDAATNALTILLYIY